MDKAVTSINDPKTSAADKRELTHHAERRSEVAQFCYCNNSVPRNSSRRIEIMTALQRFESDQTALLDWGNHEQSRTRDGSEYFEQPSQLVTCAVAGR